MTVTSHTLNKKRSEQVVRGDKLTMTLHNGPHQKLKEGRLTPIQSSHSQKIAGRELSKLTTTEFSNKLVKGKKN